MEWIRAIPQNSQKNAPSKKDKTGLPFYLSSTEPGALHS